ncbi:MAG: hypothetical protein ACI9GM_000148 [Salibacteraceae bacterium]|jgi:hypothetical protein
MAAKKTNQLMMEAYTKHLLNEGGAPKSVFAFTHANGWKESDFYKNYSDFSAIESELFFEFFEQTDSLLSKDKSFETFDAQNKLLSFYYTFFEILTANRSLALVLLNHHNSKIDSIKMLGKTHVHFKMMVRGLDIQTIKMPHEKLEALKDKGVEEAAWGQLLLTMKFWMDDTSSNFEKTDIYIEKALRAGFDIIQTSPLQSVVDLGKFLFKEKVQNKG